MGIARGIARSVARPIARAVAGTGSGGAAAFVLPAPLDDYQTGLVASASIARRLTSDYTGNLFKAFKADASTLVVGQDADGNADTAALLAWADGDSCYLQSVYMQPSGIEAEQDTNAATARRIVNSGVLETDNAGIIKAVVVADDTGRLSFPFTLNTSATLSGYMFGAHGAPRGGGSNRYMALTEDAGNSFGSAAYLDGYRSSSTAMLFGRTTAPSVTVWQYDPVASAMRYSGSNAYVDNGGQIATAAETQVFQVNRVIFGGFSTGVSYSGVGEYFQEFAIWSSDIGTADLRTVCDNARYYYATNTAWRGKKLIWVGTSMPVTVTDASNVNPYPQRVAASLGCHIVNEGSGSSRIAYDPLNAKTLSATVAEQVANGFSDVSQAAESYEKKILNQNGDPDYIVIDHCLNDYTATIGTNSSTDKTTYLGALNFIRSESLAAFPNVKFLALTPPSKESVTHADPSAIQARADALLGWCTFRNIECIDLLTALNLPVGDLGDGTHLTSASAGVVADEIIEQMLALTP